MSLEGYLGIDAGTQGLTAIFTDLDLRVIATADGHYDMVPNLPAGCYEQRPADWESALSSAMKSLRETLDRERPGWRVRAIGISAQMHGEVLADSSGQALGPARLWCDSRNEAESEELTQALNVKMPKRLTATRWLWTLRNRPDLAARVAHITTPGGWLSYKLTGRWTLGIGDASGMFPIDLKTLRYSQPAMEAYHRVAPKDARPLNELLPLPCRAGEDAGSLTEEGARLTGLPAGIPVAPAEGDQPAALAGSLIGEAGMVSLSLGTSICANAVGDRPFQGVSPAVDHFCAADGKPINMVWLRNGTTYLNSIIDLLGSALDQRSARFEAIMPDLLNAPHDCGGISALPFLDDEPGLRVNRGGLALIAGLTASNASRGSVAKAALLATLYNLRHGMDVLDAQGYPRKQLVLSGGLVRTPQVGQIVADVLNTPAVILQSASEGCAWGAALLAKYRDARIRGESRAWADFLAAHASGDAVRFEPNPAAVAEYTRGYRRHQRLLQVIPSLLEALHAS